MSYNFLVRNILELNVLIISGDVNDRIGKWKCNKVFAELTE